MLKSEQFRSGSRRRPPRPLFLQKTNENNQVPVLDMHCLNLGERLLKICNGLRICQACLMAFAALFRASHSVAAATKVGSFPSNLTTSK
jgi:hypothetical protein